MFWKWKPKLNSIYKFKFDSMVLILLAAYLDLNQTGVKIFKRGLSNKICSMNKWNFYEIFDIVNVTL